MIFSKTTEYAVRVLIFMAAKGSDFYSARYLHEKLNIPFKYLSKILTGLVNHGYLISLQGRKGGFKLVDNFEKITVAGIMLAVDGSDKSKDCILGLNNCTDDNPCAMHYFWHENKESIINMMNQTTLERLTSVNIHKF
jgi:Rrf2 family protein